MTAEVRSSPMRGSAICCLLTSFTPPHHFDRFDWMKGMDEGSRMGELGADSLSIRPLEYV